MLVDTHCHIHESNYPLDPGDVLMRARTAGVDQMICVGTSLESSREAVEFAGNHEHIYASVGVHPHESREVLTGPDAASAPEIFEQEFKTFLGAGPRTVTRIVAIGEIGLDYFYTHSPRETQIVAFEAQLQLARNHQLPIIFHVRDAFDDFWPILANFPETKGVLHSYTDDEKNLEIALGKQLFIGVNGISTFASDKQAMWDAIPLENILLETDAPFLTPVPHRGKVNEPAFVRNVAEYHAARRQIELEHLARVTSANARALFAL